MFQYLLNIINKNAANCIFIDDHLPNIQMAEELGFETIFYSSPKELRIRLEQLNILAN